MQDRLEDVLQSRALAHGLIAAGDLSSEGLRRFIRDPHFRKEAAGVSLRQHAGVDRVRLDFGVRDHSQAYLNGRLQRYCDLPKPVAWTLANDNNFLKAA